MVFEKMYYKYMHLYGKVHKMYDSIPLGTVKKRTFVAK